MARYAQKDFGLGKPTKKEEKDAAKISNQAQGKPPKKTGTNKLSAAMFAFAKANRNKLKNPTPAQKKIFAKYDAMVKAGDNPANPKPKTTPTKPVQQTKSAKTSNPKSQANTGTGRDGKPGTGTSGQLMPSDPPGMRQTRGSDKTKRTRSRAENRRSTGGTKNRSVNAVEQLKGAIKFVDTKLRLTHKKGQTKKVGNKTYRWDGKKWQLLNRPF